jgi:hypothetical protein
MPISKDNWRCSTCGKLSCSVSENMNEIIEHVCYIRVLYDNKMYAYGGYDPGMASIQKENDFFEYDFGMEFNMQYAIHLLFHMIRKEKMEINDSKGNITMYYFIISKYYDLI